MPLDLLNKLPRLSAGLFDVLTLILTSPLVATSPLAASLSELSADAVSLGKCGVPSTADVGCMGNVVPNEDGDGVRVKLVALTACSC